MSPSANQDPYRQQQHQGLIRKMFCNIEHSSDASNTDQQGQADAYYEQQRRAASQQSSSTHQQEQHRSTVGVGGGQHHQQISPNQPQQQHQEEQGSIFLPKFYQISKVLYT